MAGATAPALLFGLGLAARAPEGQLDCTVLLVASSLRFFSDPTNSRERLHGGGVHLIANLLDEEHSPSFY
jgi:hypothetical protein